ncbi:copper chaperone PCu(A)C [Streptomyces sp. NPDC053367]|uniref:copper chaperone PCu(A)C n=1 Tax=Streptomyces sp. NPDC053367 TaxID=3365700 RepID=UPI0037CE0293
MSSSLRRGALAASVIAFSFASLAACGAGNDAQTLGIKPDNAATSVGDIKVQNALVIIQPERESEGPAAVSATLYNSGDSAQTVESITVDGVGEAEIKPAEGSGALTVPAGGSVVIGGDGNATALLQDAAALADGANQKVTFAFSETGDVSLAALVVPAESYFSSWGPADVPSAPEGSASASASESGEPSEGASESPSGTPSDEASASASESAAAH